MNSQRINFCYLVYENLTIENFNIKIIFLSYCLPFFFQDIFVISLQNLRKKKIFSWGKEKSIDLLT